jgi:hypothetical protein
MVLDECQDLGEILPRWKEGISRYLILFLYPHSQQARFKQNAILHMSGHFRFLPSSLHSRPPSHLMYLIGATPSYTVMGPTVHSRTPVATGLERPLAARIRRILRHAKNRRAASGRYLLVRGAVGTTPIHRLTLVFETRSFVEVSFRFDSLETM